MKKRKNSLVLKFLIPYIISMFAICIMVYILYFPQYEKRFLKAEESNINNLTVILENRILSLYGKVNIFCSFNVIQYFTLSPKFSKRVFA